MGPYDEPQPGLGWRIAGWAITLTILSGAWFLPVSWVRTNLDRTVTPTAVSDQRWYEDGSYGTKRDGGCWPGMLCDGGRK